MPINITYDSNSSLNTVDNLGMDISTTLIGYNSGDGSIESTIQFIVPNNVSLEGAIILECSILTINNASVTFVVNTSGKEPIS